MSAPERSVRSRRHLRRYVLANEQVVVATRLHRAKLLEPALTTVAVAIVVAWLHSATDFGWVWVLWLVAAGRFAFRWAEWNYEWFIATDKRLILTYGLVIHKVAMMPMMKVTDMGYSRTPVGQILGYGRFVMESAGQDQALRQIDFVPDPDQTYRTLCGTIFMPRGTDQRGGQSQQARPPAIVPQGSREPKPTTAELPVVAGPPGTEPTWDATTQPPAAPDRPIPAPPSESPTTHVPPSGTGPVPQSASSQGYSQPDRGRPWRRKRRSLYDLPPVEGGGATVPDPFL